MAGGKWKLLSRTLLRKRIFSTEQLEEGDLRRCLSIWDVISLGVGSSLGLGVYVLLGAVARDIAGPSVVLSFLIAAVAALFAGLCYAELGARAPRAGSAYTYAYLVMGELVAFFIGWIMILEGVFGAASIARGLSMYVDHLSNSSMSTWFQSFVPISSPPFSTHFDFFSFFLVIIIGGTLAVGVRESTTVNNFFSVVSLLTVLFVVALGAFQADASNWQIPAANVTEGHGTGGFFPYGGWGVLKGAAVCFYGFVGFDTISFAAEEVHKPRRSVPRAILSTLGVALVLYVGAATVVTMVVPYHTLDPIAAVSTAFSYVEWEWAAWVVSIGAIFAILSSLLGCMYALPRLLYSMASDGLFFPCLASVSAARKSPVFATLLPTGIIAVAGAVIDIREMVVMMCLATLAAYSVVATCVIVMRYRSKYDVAGPGYLPQMMGRGHHLPSKVTTNIVYINLILFACMCFAIGILLEYASEPLVYLIVLHVLAVLSVVSMTLQPQIQEELKFRTPLVPVVPCLSIYVNIQLMVLLSTQTWIRVFVWMGIGIPVYITCICCFKPKETIHPKNNHSGSHEANGKHCVRIYIESPTPPGTTKSSNIGGEDTVKEEELTLDHVTVDRNIIKRQPIITEEIVKVQHAYIEDSDEKEAKIIDMLDQVLQAEEDSYTEVIRLKEPNEGEVAIITEEPLRHRNSVSNLSDADSDASMGNLVLPKYDVIAQVHREDLPKVTEEEEKLDKDEFNNEDDNIEKMEELIETVIEPTAHDEVTAFNDSDSRTDESGYSDTIDKMGFSESIIDSKEDIPNIPTPPPLDENFFANPGYKKSYTVSVRSSKSKPIEFEEIKPRESIKSGNSADDAPMVFGSDKQLHFMSKLNNIFQNKISNDTDSDVQRKRSNSTGNVAENTDVVWTKERPSYFADLTKEIASRESANNLPQIETVENKLPISDEDEKKNSLSRHELKFKLESIFAAGGPQSSKPRIMKSNPPTPEESFQNDLKKSETMEDLPKVEKNDTLKRQKTKFGEVLNSFRLTLNKDDQVL